MEEVGNRVNLAGTSVPKAYYNYLVLSAVSWDGGGPGYVIGSVEQTRAHLKEAGEKVKHLSQVLPCS